MDLLSKYDDVLIDAFWVTIKLTVVSAICALILGTILAAMRVAPVPVMRGVGTAYVTIFRNTPLTLIIIFCLFVLSQTLGINLANPSSPTFIVDNNFRLAVLGLSVYTAAFVCESLRAGINTVPVGQAEAGRSLGLTFSQNLRLIVLPQAFRAVIAPLGSVLIALTKNTTIASVIGVVGGVAADEDDDRERGADLRHRRHLRDRLRHSDPSGRRVLRLAVAEAGGREMSGESTVLYDAPGPRARMRNHVLSVIVALLVVLVGWVVYRALDAKGQLTAAKWDPFLQATSWTTYLIPGIKGTLTAAALSIVFALILGAVLGIGRMSDHRWVRAISGSIVELFRAIPVLILMIFAVSACSPSTRCSRSRRPRAGRGGDGPDALQRLGDRRDRAGRHPVAAEGADRSGAVPRHAQGPD